MAVANNLMTRAGLDVKPFMQGSKKLKGEFNTINRKFQRASGGISKTVGAGMSLQVSALKKVLGGYAGWTAAAVAAGATITRATKDAMLVDAALGQINFLLGENAQSFEDWADSQASAYGMAKSEAVRFGAVYANLVSVFAKDTKQATTMTEDLLKASAVVASSSGRAMTDVMERIRSGMLGNTEAIEDLGVNVQANALQETKAFKQMANGAKNWDSITSQTLKQQIRYYAILEQVQGRFGSKMRDNVSTRMLLFNAQLKNVGTNIGGMFIPLLNAVLPSLTAIVDAMSKATKVAAEFMTSLFGYKPKALDKTSKEATDSLDAIGDSAVENAKKAKGALAGFDKINVLSSGETGSTTGTATGGNAPNQLDTGGGTSQLFNASKKIEEIANKVREVLGGMFNNPTFQKYYTLLIDSFGKLWEIISGYYKKLYDIVTSGVGKQFFDGIENLFKFLYPIVKFFVDMIISDLKTFLDGITKIFEGLLKFFGGMLTGDWKTMWDGFKEILIGTLEAGWIVLQYFFGGKVFGLIGKFFGKFGEIIAGGVKTLGEPFSRLFTWIETIFTEFFTGAFKGGGTIGKNLLANIKNLWEGVILGFEEFFTNFGKLFTDSKLLQTFTNFGKNVWNIIKNQFGEIGTIAWSKMKSAFGSFSEFISEHFNIKKLSTSVIERLSSIGKSMWDSIKEGFKNPKEWFKEIVNGMIKLVNGFISKINDVLSFEVAGKKFGVNLPKIPYLAKGGIVDSPTVAMIGEAGKEAVMPLENNTGWINELADKLNNIGGGSAGDIVINIGGTTLAKINANEMNRLNRQAGKTVYNV